MEQRKDVKVKIGGLWKNQSKNGAMYLKGPFGLLDLLIIENKEKFSPNSPDFTAYLVEKEEKTKTHQNNFREPSGFKKNEEMPF